MKLRRNKKGFTIVELVIVIAVIGILAAVLIPTFVNLNNKANKAADESLVKNLNTALAMQEQEIGDTKNNTLHDAVLDLENYGYLLPNLVTKSSDKLLWNQKTNRFILEDGDKEGYPNVNFWRIQDDANDADGYSIYAGLKFDLTTVNVKVGFDAGYKTHITDVSYTRVPTGNEKQEVSIRTKGNMCVLTINAQNDHVDHYGYAKTTKVVAVNSENSYHEYGTSNELVVTKGKVVIEDSGVVFDLKPAEGSSSTDYNVTNAGGNVMGSEISSVVPSTSFEINSLAQLESFRDATNSGERFAGKNVNLNVDIVLNRAWTPISNYTRNLSGEELNSLAFGGVFDGKNHTITGLTNVGLNISEVNTGTNKSTPKNGSEVTYGFFASTSGATIKNLKFADVNITNEGFGELLGDSVAACVGFTMGESTIEGVKVLSGKVEGFDATAGVLGRDKGSSLTIKNCSNAAEVFSFQGAAGVACRVYSSDPACHLIVDNCQNSGKITSDYKNAPEEVKYDACYAVGIVETRNNISGEVKNCTNTGNIIRRKPATGKTQEGHIAQISTATTKAGYVVELINNVENGTTTVLEA